MRGCFFQAAVLMRARSMHPFRVAQPHAQTALSSRAMATTNATTKAKSKTYEVKLVRDGSMCFIPVTFDPVTKLELDTEERTVTPPPDFVKELKKAKAWKAWEALSFTHQREHVEAIEQAKKPETRARRIVKSVAMIAAK